MLRRAVLGAVVLAVAAAGDAAAVEGVLTQKAGTEACVTETGSGGACQDGRGLDLGAETAISPDGENVYVGSSTSGAVAVFDRDPLTGQVRQKAGLAGCISENGSGGDCTDGIGLSQADGVVVSPDGENVYVAGQDSDAVAVFDRDTSTGVLTQKSNTEACVSETGTGGLCANGTALDGAVGLAISADGEFLYAVATAADSVVVFDRDAATGTLAQLSCVSLTGTGGACATAPALDAPYPVISLSPDQKNLYVPTVSSHSVVTFTRDTATGALTFLGCVSDTGSGGDCADGHDLLQTNAVLVAPDGEHAYVASSESDAVHVFGRDGTTGALTQQACVSDSGSLGACADGVALDAALGLGMDAAGETLYVAAHDSNAIAVLDIDPAAGAIAQKAGTAGCVAEDGLGGLCADGTALVQPRGRISVTSDGANVYVATQESDSLAVFDRGLNGRPTCLAVTATVVHDVPIDIPMQCTDPDGDAITREVVTGPAHGVLGTPGATIRYTPAAGYTGADSFAFRATDAGGAGATVSVSITVTNSPPSCANASATVGRGQSVAIQLSCTDSDDASLTLAAASAPQRGTVGAIDQLTRTVTYTATGSPGGDSFTFTATDATGAKATATVNLTVTGGPPTCPDAAVTTPPAVAVAVTLSCTDPDGDPVTLSILDPPERGKLGAIEGGKVTYTPDAGFTGTDRFVFRGTSADGQSTPATAAVTVVAPKPVPVAITQIAKLPPPHVCVSRRRFRIHLRKVGANRIVRAQIKLNTIVRTVKGRALSLPIDLRGLPKGKVRVVITTTNAEGKRVVGRRTYRTCVPRRRS